MELESLVGLPGRAWLCIAGKQDKLWPQFTLRTLWCVGVYVFPRLATA